MQPTTDRPVSHRPAAALYVLVASLLAFQVTQLESAWRYPLGVAAILLVILSIRALRSASTVTRHDP